MELEEIFDNYIFWAVFLITFNIIAIINGGIIIRCYFIQPKYRNTFTTICLARAVAHIINSCLYGTVCAVKILVYDGFEIAPPSLPWYWRLDSLVPISYLTVAPTELLLALNRFVAINFWHLYSSIFCLRNTWIACGCCWLVALLFFIERSFGGCYVYFSPSQWIFAYSTSECQSTDESLIYIYTIPCMIISVGITLFTFGQLMHKLKTSNQSDAIVCRRLYANIRLFSQSFIINMIWLISTMFWVLNSYSWFESMVWHLFAMNILQLLAHSFESVVLNFFHHYHIKKGSHQTDSSAQRQDSARQRRQIVPTSASSRSTRKVAPASQETTDAKEVRLELDRQP